MHHLVECRDRHCRDLLSLIWGYKGLTWRLDIEGAPERVGQVARVQLHRNDRWPLTFGRNGLQCYFELGMRSDSMTKSAQPFRKLHVIPAGKNVEERRFRHWIGEKPLFTLKNLHVNKILLDGIDAVIEDEQDRWNLLPGEGREG